MYDAGCCSKYQAEMLLKQSMHSGAFVDQNPFVSILFSFAFDLDNSWSDLSLRLTRFIQMVSLFEVCTSVFRTGFVTCFPHNK